MIVLIIKEHLYIFNKVNDNDIFLDNFKQPKIFSKQKKTFKCWRYVDDTFLLWEHNREEYIPRSNKYGDTINYFGVEANSEQ